MKIGLCKSVLAAFVLARVVLATSSADAAVPEKTIKAHQDSAPEALEITVVSATETTQAQPVAGQPGCTRTAREQTVTAKVDVVRRSAGGVQPGSTIVFRNSVVTLSPCALPGANFGTQLSAGDRAEAYLRPAGTADGMFLANDLKRLR
jgi:hypothetical protein